VKGVVDTQWPRYQVFMQDKPGSPYQDMGSIHAPDAEMALLNARDVFVRRNECVSLWIVPAKAIFSRTAQEIQEYGLEMSSLNGLTVESETYFVFAKIKPSGTYTSLGSVEASHPFKALRTAVGKFSPGKTVFAWWVIPAGVVISSDPLDVDSFFKPALDKPFRLSTDFHTVSMMRQIKSGKIGPVTQVEKGKANEN
jgi:ring-1,2-phenylacetyl-CoA epoxidase subunit PaaB